MKRRAFIAAFTCAALLPMSARPQEVKVPWKIGLLPLGSSSNAYDLSLVEAFRQGLVDAGLAEKRDYTLDVLWPAADPNPAIEELIGRGVHLLAHFIHEVVREELMGGDEAVGLA
jgi:ABC-type sugar transport system substrate-binding protein